SRPAGRPRRRGRHPRPRRRPGCPTRPPARTPGGTRGPAARARTPPRARGACRGRGSLPGGSSRDAHRDQERLGGQVLERVEAVAERAHLGGGQVTPLTIEPGDGLAQAEVAGRPGAWPSEVAGEVPVRGP